MPSAVKIPDIFLEIFIYFLLWGGPYIIITGLLFLALRRLPKNRPFLRPLRLLYLLPLCLFVAGGVADVLWYTFVHEIKYYYWDYAADFTPFSPIYIYTGYLTPGGQYNGPLHGATVAEITRLWSTYAMWTWLAAGSLWLILAYSLPSRLISWRLATPANP